MHYVVNLHGQAAAAARLGYDLFDMGPEPSLANALPAGQQALVWLGNLDNTNCSSPGYSWTAFTAAVRAMAGNPKVFGYFLSDEPHPGGCPNAVADIARRADYIRATDPTHKSFIVVLDGSNACGAALGCEYHALQPAHTHVDLIGVDPYPCNVGNAGSGCDYSKIDSRVHSAESNGIPASVIVPVFQLFGQSCNSGSHYYRMPTVLELTTMLAHWSALVPHPVMDYSYSWGEQSSSCPTLADATGLSGQPNLQSVMAAHNRL